MGSNCALRLVLGGATKKPISSSYMKANLLIAITAAVLCVASGAAARPEEPASSRAAAAVPLWPKGQMPGRVSTGSERELPARGDKVIRLPDEELSPVFREPWSKNPVQRWAWGISTKELTTPAVLRQAGCPAKRNENQPWSP